MFYLYDNDPPIKVVHQALHHDVPELFTGDLPATAKWRFEGVAEAMAKAEEHVIKEWNLANHELPEKDCALIKFADMMDLNLKCMEELSTGNSPFGAILNNGLMYCKMLLDGPLKGHERAHGLLKVLFNHPFINVEEIVINDPDKATLQ